MADVVLGVEVGVVDPYGPALAQRHGGELLPVARHEVQAILDRLDELAVRRRVAVEGHDGRHVHVRAAGLEVQERGVQRGQAVM